MGYKKENKRRKISNNRILILCEGKTEKVYLQGLVKTFPRRSQYDFDLKIIQANHSEPVTALNELKTKIKKAKREKQPYTHSWLVFDDDKRNLNTLFEKLINQKISFVYNSISIEFWFLLHYKDTTRQFENADSVIKELEKNYGSFSKTDPDLWNKLKPYFKTAEKRAIKIRHKHINNKTTLSQSKPYTNMDKLVNFISTFG